MANATLLYTNLFTPGAGGRDDFGDIDYQYKCRAEQFNRVANFAGKPYAMRHYQSPTNGCPEFDGVTIKHRTQMLHAMTGNYTATYPNGLKLKPTDVGYIWWGFSHYIPSSNPTSGGAATHHIVWDLKSNSTDFGEPTAYLIYGNTLWLNPNEAYRITATLPFDTWNRIIVYIERRITGGRFKFWLNDTLIEDYTGQTLISLPSNVYTFFRTGPYWGTETRAAGPTHYFTDIRIAQGGSDGYVLVDPKQSVSPPPDPPPPEPAPVIMPLYAGHLARLMKRRKD